MLWNNMAIVPFVQNFLTSLLIAHIFFTLFKRGLPLYWLVPCYLFVVLSVPVGLYTIILWKDVPFALVAVFLGFKLAVLHADKRMGRLDISLRHWVGLFVLTILLAGIRHNGVLYIIVVPLFLVIFRIIRIRPIVSSGIILTGILVFSAFFYLPGGLKTTSYLSSQTSRYLGQAVNHISPDYIVSCGKKYLGIFDVNQKKMQWDLVHLCMYGRYTNDFLRQLRWNDVYPYLPLPRNRVSVKANKVAWWLYWKSYEIPWVYFSWNPVYILFLYPGLLLFYRKLPMASAFSFLVFLPVAVLVFLNIFNWRYYYFANLASYFVIPLILTDLYMRKTNE